MSDDLPVLVGKVLMIPWWEKRIAELEAELASEHSLNNRLRTAMESERSKYTATLSDRESTIVSQQEELWRLRDIVGGRW